jgi:phosphohistidine phosphatase
MIIYFLRHGDATESPSLHDSDRPLSEFGEHQASSVGHFLSKVDRGIKQILTSPLVRAQQSAEAVQRELGPIPIQPTEHLTSSSDPRNIIRELQKANTGTVLLVGHEPHLSRTISLLISGDARTVVEMRKGSLACVSTPDPLKEGAGILQWLLPSERTLK